MYASWAAISPSSAAIPADFTRTQTVRWAAAFETKEALWKPSVFLTLTAGVQNEPTSKRARSIELREAGLVVRLEMRNVDAVARYVEVHAVLNDPLTLLEALTNGDYGCLPPTPLIQRSRPKVTAKIAFGSSLRPRISAEPPEGRATNSGASPWGTRADYLAYEDWIA